MSKSRIPLCLQGWQLFEWADQIHQKIEGSKPTKAFRKPTAAVKSVRR